MNGFLFVYGTLRPGGHETFGIPGQLFDLGRFPGIKLGGEKKVICERIPVDDWGPLDRYEGFDADDPNNSLYIRRSYLLLTEVGPFEGFIYEFNRDVPAEKLIESGDWLAHTKKERGSHGRGFGKSS